MKIGFLSDIHEDYSALRKAVRVLERVQCDVLVCLGDIVGFSFPYQRALRGRDAEACVALVREQCVASVAGNHDLFAVRRVPTYNAGFRYGTDWYVLDEHHRQRRAGRRLWRYEDCDVSPRLSAGAQEYLHALPECAVAHLGGMPIFLSHFRYPDLSGSLVSSLRLNRLLEHFDFVRSRGCTLGFSGHGHPEGVARAENGSVVFNGFGSYAVHRGEQWIVSPAIARTGRASGVLAFDTRSFDLEVIALHVP
ncbi:MAG: metallophosphoesterase family protein [Bacteroidetes bacterium]|nr:metallophosphoesterase family protein [Bacteroidota bacterium]